MDILKLLMVSVNSLLTFLRILRARLYVSEILIGYVLSMLFKEPLGVIPRGDLVPPLLPSLFVKFDIKDLLD